MGSEIALSNKTKSNFVKLMPRRLNGSPYYDRLGEAMSDIHLALSKVGLQVRDDIDFRMYRAGESQTQVMRCPIVAKLANGDLVEVSNSLLVLSIYKEPTTGNYEVIAYLS